MFIKFSDLVINANCISKIRVNEKADKTFSVIIFFGETDYESEDFETEAEAIARRDEILLQVNT